MKQDSAPRTTLSPRWRMPLMALAFGALLVGMWAGLLRLGWAWPVIAPSLPANHGPLMVCGFLGVLIGLERAVGLGHRWVFASPALTATGVLLLLLQVTPELAVVLITIGSLLLVIALIELLRIQLALFTATIVLGAVLWLVGNLVWLAGWPIPVVTLWWIGFLVITVAGERLELSRMLRLSAGSRALFLVAVIVCVVGMVIGLIDYALGMRVLGLGLLVLALWLLVYDIARRRIKAGGLARFIAISLISGYVWLAIGGALALWLGGTMAGPWYDAILHTIFLGFVFTMIFAHAPIIFPAVLHLPIEYTPRFYSHLVLLDITLLLRVTGDLIPWWPARLWGGLLNAVVLLLFLFNTVTSIRRK
jgi:hypothetical protein